MRVAIFLPTLLLLAACGGASGSNSLADTSAASDSANSASLAIKTPTGPDLTPESIPDDVPETLDGEELRYGVSISGSTRLKSASVGVSFVVPAGWTAVQGAGGYMLTMMPPAAELVNLQAQGIIGGVWIGLSGVGDENLRALLSLPIPLPVAQYTLVFQPDGQPVVDGNRYTQKYTAQTAYGTFRGRSVAVRGPAGNAMLATLSGSDDRQSRIKQVIDAMAESARFAKPQDAQRRKDAIGLLAGRRLLKMESHYNRRADGTTASRTSDAVLDLYADGNYTYSLSTSHDTTGTGGRGSAAGSAQSGAKGRWWIVIGHATEFLVLQPEGHPVQSHAITIQNGSLFISGQNVGITDIG